MPVKKINYVEMELAWLETKMESLKKYIDNNAIENLQDRVAWKEVRGGGRMPVVVATIEQQITSLRNTMADYLKMMEAIAKLRENEDKAKAFTPRGTQQLSPREMRMIPASVPMTNDRPEPGQVTIMDAFQ